MVITLYRSAKFSTRGYIAGEAPDGLVTLNSAPGRAEINLFAEATNAWLRSTLSTSAGIYQFDSLDRSLSYYVLGKDLTGTYNHVVMGRITPAEYA